MIGRTNATRLAGVIPAISEVHMPTPLVHSISEACSITRTGRAALYEAIKLGRLRAVKRGRRTLIFSEDLRRWLETLPSVTETDVTPKVSVCDRECV